MPQISIARYRPFQWQDILSPRSNEQYQGRCWDFPLTSRRYDPRGPVLRISADCVHPNQREGLAYSTIYRMSTHMSTLFCSDSGVVVYLHPALRRESSMEECRKTSGIQVPDEPLELSA